jgi:hypothetical protein
MGLRFRRSWGVLPGIRLNLGLKSGSVSFGPRGLHYTIGTRGSWVTVGLPGSGLHWTQKINSPFASSQVGAATQAPGMFNPHVTGSPQRAAQSPGAQTLHAPQYIRPKQSPLAPAAHSQQAPQFARPLQSSSVQSQTAPGAAQSPPATFSPLVAHVH